jgi:hypothetical protein
MRTREAKVLARRIYRETGRSVELRYFDNPRHGVYCLNTSDAQTGQPFSIYSAQDWDERVAFSDQLTEVENGS